MQTDFFNMKDRLGRGTNLKCGVVIKFVRIFQLNNPICKELILFNLSQFSRKFLCPLSILLLDFNRLAVSLSDLPQRETRCPPAPCYRLYYAIKCETGEKRKLATYKMSWNFARQVELMWSRSN